jgi:hypothetical protein
MPPGSGDIRITVLNGGGTKGVTWDGVNGFKISLVPDPVTGIGTGSFGFQPPGWVVTGTTDPASWTAVFYDFGGSYWATATGTGTSFVFSAGDYQPLGSAAGVDLEVDFGGTGGSSMLTPSQSMQSNVGTNSPPPYSAAPAYTQEDVDAVGLVTLQGDKYDKNKFAVLNDLEFTELVSSIEGIGIDEFFVLYEELKDSIEGGSVNFDLMVEMNNPNSVLVEAQSIVNNLRDALKLGDSDPTLYNEILRNTRTQYQSLIDKVSKLQDLFKDADPKTHAYLVANSLPYVVEINRKFKAIFDFIVVLLDQNAELIQQVADLQTENESLKQQVKQLNDLVLKLMGPGVSGFQVIPNLYTKDALQGTVWVAGSSAQLVVCGSSQYYFGPTRAEGQKEYTSPEGISFVQRKGSSIWDVATPITLAGKMTYVSVNSYENPAESEQLVFVFPAPVVIPPAGPLVSSLGTNISLVIPDHPNDPDEVEEFYRQGYRSQVVTKITGGTPPYKMKVNITPGKEFFDAQFGNELI